jgi:3-hydroxyacyl-CoA dehydrogenase/3a,7a,12a-trihydroxy-5b-cholest-24-enoyl-CoA hydratase
VAAAAPKAAVAAAAPVAPAPAASELSTAQTFEVIGAYVAAHPELVKQVNVLYQFKVKNPDSQWVLDLKVGAVRAGVVDKPECTLEIADADWLDMVSGKADPMKLFQGGKLKISGNVMASQKLDFLKKMDRSAVPSAAPAAAAPPAAPAPTPAAAPVEVLAPRVFKALQERLAKQPGLAKEVGAVISFKVKDAGFEFTADLASSPPTVKPGADPAAGTRLILTDEALGALVRGEDAGKLFQHGQLRVEGALPAAHHLGFLKQLV